MKIEDNVPIPPRRGKPQSPATLAALSMNVGQSMVCSTIAQMETVRAALRRAGMRTTTRKIEEEAWRVWRVA